MLRRPATKLTLTLEDLHEYDVIREQQLKDAQSSTNVQYASSEIESPVQNGKSASVGETVPSTRSDAHHSHDTRSREQRIGLGTTRT